MRLVENLQLKMLGPLKKEKEFESYVEELGSYVRRRIGLLKLPTKAQQELLCAQDLVLLMSSLCKTSER